MDIGVDTETLIWVIEFLSTADVQHSLFVADGYDTGRVTRTGLALSADAELPDEETLVNQLATDAESTNSLEEENRLILQAFWVIQVLWTPTLTRNMRRAGRLPLRPGG